MTVEYGGKTAQLTRNETRILACLMQKQLCTRTEIIEDLWNNSLYVDENTLAVAIRRLRVKIEEDPGEPRRIRTVHGQGYLWQA